MAYGRFRGENASRERRDTPACSGLPGGGTTRECDRRAGAGMHERSGCLWPRQPRQFGLPRVGPRSVPLWSPPDFAPRDQRLARTLEFARREWVQPTAQLVCRRARRMLRAGIRDANRCRDRSMWLLQTLSVASGAQPAKLDAGSAGRACPAQSIEARGALVGAGRIPLHGCTLPVVNPVRYPLSAAAEYNLSGEITKVTTAAGQRVGVRR